MYFFVCFIYIARVFVPLGNGLWSGDLFVHWKCSVKVSCAVAVIGMCLEVVHSERDGN